MCKKIILRFLIIFLITNLYCYDIKAQSTPNSEQPKSKIQIDFDMRSVEKIILHPEDVLKNEDEFWTTDEAYKLLVRWANNNSRTLSRDDWRDAVRKLTLIPESQRKNNKIFVAVKEVYDNKQKFIDAAIPHILSFLPKSVPDCGTTIYFTAETPGTGFMTNGKIVMNLGASRLKNDIGYMQNLLLHEVYHIGYGYNRSNRLEYKLENNSLYNILDALQNEGMATYTAYTALNIYPTENEDDFKMLEDKNIVEALVHSLNDFFIKAERMTPDELQKEGWNVGVSQRAYYVAGAFMAKSIDEKLGREALLGTIEQGPRSFVTVYNSTVDENLSLYEFKMPDNISAWQQLVHAYKNMQTNLIDDLEEKVIEEQNGDERSLNSLGYFLIRKNRIKDAVRVFKFIVKLHPNSANAYDSLAEAYMKVGEKELAIKNYKKSVELNPNNENAKNWIMELEKD